MDGLSSTTDRVGADLVGAHPASLFAGTGEMYARCRELDWAATPLGPVDAWPISLRTAVSIVLGSSFPSILVWGPELVQIYNDAYIPLIGTKHPAALGAPTHECWPEIEEIQRPIFQRVFAGRSVELTDAPYQLNRGDGSEVAYFKATFIPVLGERGAVAGSLSILFETTSDVRQRPLIAERERLLEAERVARAQVERLNAELQRALSDLRAVLEVVPIGIGISQDPECADIRVNPAFAQQLGVETDVNASKSGPGGEALPFRVLRNGREVPAHELPMQRAARERRMLDAQEYDIVHHDGRVVRLLEYAAPLIDADGTLRGAVGAFIDITERTRLIEAERAARAEAERANRAKAEFLAVMSHELRTPLNAIGGYAELLAMGVRGPVTSAQLKDLERIQRSQRHLLGLINEVLNYARTETGSIQFRFERVDMGTALSSLESLILPQVREKEITFQVAECDPHLSVLADREKLQQILVNLLSNAVKFTDEGGRIEVGCEPAEDGAAVAITVEDDGIGIPADKLDVIFDPFVQVGRARNNPGEGVGLGLAISRDLARGMGGDLVARSTLGAGSAFTLTLPSA